MNNKLNPEMTDDDNPEWTADDFKNSQPYSVLSETLRAKLRRPRGPNKSPTKVRINIRLSSEVLQHFRAMGDGWQTRIDGALKDWMTRHHA